MLTAKKVERVKRPGRYRDGAIRGLYLQISPGGGKSWLLRYERSGETTLTAVLRKAGTLDVAIAY